MKLSEKLRAAQGTESSGFALLARLGAAAIIVLTLFCLFLLKKK